MSERDPRPMDALHLAAEYVGAAVVITSSADRRDGNRRRYLSDRPGAQLTRLAVVRPNRDAPSRWDQLNSGIPLCIASLETLTIDQAAVLLLDHESLQRQRRQAA